MISLNTTVIQTLINFQHGFCKSVAAKQHFVYQTVIAVCYPGPTATISVCTPAWKPGNWEAAVCIGIRGTSWRRKDDAVYRTTAEV